MEKIKLIDIDIEMGNIATTEKPYFISDRSIVKRVSIEDIELPACKTLDKYTHIHGPKGLFMLDMELEVVDIGDVLDVDPSELSRELINELMRTYKNASTPVVLSIMNSSIIMLSAHYADLTERSDTLLKSMYRFTCNGYVLENRKRNNTSIMCCGKGYNILDLPNEVVSLDVTDRIVKEMDIDIIVSEHVIRRSYVDIKVKDGIFNVYIKCENENTWILSATGDTDPIRVSAAVINWRTSCDRNSLLSQLKPYLYTE